MSSNATHAHLLIEVHTEELPPKSLRSLAEHFCDDIKARLQKAELPFQAIQSFATPRRLAVLVHQLTSEQPDKQIERKGPALDKAFDATGQATAACLGFAKSCGVDVSTLTTLATPQGKFVGCQQSIQGKTVQALLPTLVEESLNALPIPKPMRWGAHTQKFIRPIHSVILLYGTQVIQADILGCPTGNIAYGHRFMHPAALTIEAPEHYQDSLRHAFVIADFAERKNKIVKDTENLVKQTLGDKARAILDANLLDEVTSLVEWPEALCGSFNENFLRVPQEALISSMQDHQRYFPIVDQDNKLLPYFITISNIQNEDKQRVIAGNERVLRARLSDAAFFFDQDKKTPLTARVEKIKSIIFQNKLGTLFDKTERLQKLTVMIAKHLDIDPTLADRAALLAKTDLTTDLVGEFPELQGIAGYYYAKNQEDDSVAIAQNEQYMPRFSGDQLPETKLGCALALADRIDTLVGVFGIHQTPTGDKDPFGLRRAAIGILRILIEKRLDLDLAELLHYACQCYQVRLDNTEVIPHVLSFIFERLRYWYQEQNISADIFAAVNALNITRLYDFHRRIQAVQVFKKLQEAESLSVANKRVSNILAKYSDALLAKHIDEKLFEYPEEHALAKALATQVDLVTPLYQAANYVEVLSQLSSLRKAVDLFFDKVLVMAEDKAIRENRLLLLMQLRKLFLQIADIALLQP